MVSKWRKIHLPKQKIHEILVETSRWLPGTSVCNIPVNRDVFGTSIYNLVYWYENQNQAGAWAVRMKKRVMFAASL